MSNRLELMKFVSSKIRYLTGFNKAKFASGEMATLRLGVMKQPGAVIGATSFALADIPSDLKGHAGVPTKAEWAAYTALTLYACHQQGHAAIMHVPETSLGKAYRTVLAKDKLANERFNQMISELSKAQRIEQLAARLKKITSWLSSQGAGLDYVQLAGDIYDWQFQDSRNAVFLKWVQDFVG